MSVDRVLLVPGLGLGPESWDPTLAHLRSDAPAQVVPLPGFGVPARGRDLAPRGLAEQLLGRLGARSHRLLLVGHSASSQVVAHAAVLAPDRVAGLVLVGPTTDPRAASWPGLALRWLRDAGHEPPRQVPTLVRQYARTSVPSLVRAMDRARRDRVDRTVAEYAGPVLVVRGRHDRICPADWAAAVADRSRDGTVRTLPAGAHMVPLTHGRLLAPVLQELLRPPGRGDPPPAGSPPG